jgi:hypothetical protein
MFVDKGILMELAYAGRQDLMDSFPLSHSLIFLQHIQHAGLPSTSQARLSLSSATGSTSLVINAVGQDRVGIVSDITGLVIKGTAAILL